MNKFYIVIFATVYCILTICISAVSITLKTIDPIMFLIVISGLVVGFKMFSDAIE